MRSQYVTASTGFLPSRTSALECMSTDYEQGPPCRCGQTVSRYFVLYFPNEAEPTLSPRASIPRLWLWPRFTHSVGTASTGSWLGASCHSRGL